MKPKKTANYTDAEKAAYYRKKKQAYKQKAQPKPRTKAYKKAGVLSSAGSGLGGALGTALGGPAGTAIGSFLGGKLGHLAEMITGFGDYEVQQNSIMNGGMSPPQINNSIEHGGAIIRHREFIQDIQSAGTAFNALKFSLNPGQSTTFPWLAQIAANYDQYRFRGLLFEFKSTSSDAILSGATNSSLGSVSMATDYDSADLAYSSKREMLNSMFSCSDKPSNTFIHPIECKTSLSPMRMQYVRDGPVPPNTDVRMYDLGNFFIATEGQQGAAPFGSLGELWVTYEIEFYKQQIGFDGRADNFKITNAVAGAWLSPSAANHLADPQNSIGGAINDAGVTYTFPANVSSGKYLFYYTVDGPVAAITGAQVPLLSNCKFQDIWNLPANFIQTPASGSTVNDLAHTMCIQVTGPGATVTYITSVIPTGATRGNLVIAQVEKGFTDF